MTAKQKIFWLRLVTLIGLCLPALELAWRWYNGDLEPRPVTVATHSTGDWAVIFLMLSLAMSYKRAWELVADINESFAEPLVAAQTGGKSGGGAALTPRGEELVRHYRAIERKALSATASHLKALQAISRNRRRK